MPFEDVMGTVMQWLTATDAVAALGAELATQQPGADAPPEIVAALRAVSTAAGITDLDELAPQQQGMLLGVIRMYLRQANELLDNPTAAPGWRFTDPVILDGYGRGSAMVPQMIAAAHADLAEVSGFLDVGTGVGLLAIAATNVWPRANVVGIDTWKPSLDRAATNVEGAGAQDRVELREQDLVDLPDVETFDCAWVPTFFLDEATLEAGLANVSRALRPGGWVALGRMRPSPDPVAEASAALRWIRSGGGSLDDKRATELLETAGFEAIFTAEPKMPVPIDLTLGRRPS